jgi:hypothetical protein
MCKWMVRWMSVKKFAKTRIHSDDLRLNDRKNPNYMFLFIVDRLKNEKTKMSQEI